MQGETRLNILILTNKSMLWFEMIFFLRDAIQFRSTSVEISNKKWQIRSWFKGGTRQQIKFVHVISVHNKIMKHASGEFDYAYSLAVLYMYLV